MMSSRRVSGSQRIAVCNHGLTPRPTDYSTLSWPIVLIGGVELGVNERQHALVEDQRRIDNPCQQRWVW